MNKTQKSNPKKVINLFIYIGIGTSIFFMGKHIGNQPNTDISNSDREIVDVSGQVIDGTLPYGDTEKLKEALQKQVDKSMLAIKINSNPYFETSTSEGMLGIENPSNNNYSFQVEITLDESEETIYTSPMLKPGQYILTDKLSYPLNEGSYQATAVFYAYDDNGTNIGKVGAGLNIEIGN